MRVRSPARSLPRNGCKASLNRRGSEQGHQAHQVACEEGVDLENKVLQWLKNSKPPKLGSSRFEPRLQQTLESSSEYESNIMQDNAEIEVLFHPDFADWTLLEGPKTQIVPALTTENPLRALDDAAASIAELLGIPRTVFCDDPLPFCGEHLEGA
jgi:hypothetical protein